MSGTANEGESGGGLIKVITASVSAITALLVAVSEVTGAMRDLSNVDHGLISTFIFSFFAIYVVADIIRWRDDWTVWLYGIAVMAMAAYWWIGFMAMHGIPPEPIIPENLNPPRWAYFAITACIAGWAIWDMKDAMKDDFDDKKTVATGAIVLLIGLALCLYLTIRGPSGV